MAIRGTKNDESLVECPICDGMGKIPSPLWSLEGDHDCETCKGTGKVTPNQREEILKRLRSMFD